MTSTQPPAAARFTRDNLRHMLRHGLSTAVFCCLIAAALAISGRGAWHVQLVYSLAIGLISWLVIDIGRLWLSGNQDKLWPGGLRGVLLVAAGVVVGFIGGNAVGDAWTGAPLLQFRTFTSDKLASTLVTTIVACVGICYIFYSHGKSKYLEGAVAMAQRDATEARLKLLEAQLEPHMLFNTLANLRALIAADPPRAIAMLDRLNGYLRATLQGSRALSHPLGAEFDRLGDYLALMSVRMGPRLAYVLDLPDALRELPVPPLLLQPLVENSIRHGLEPKVDGGRITVRARHVGGALRLDVIDTGIGPDSGALGPSAGDGFGLAQVRERLATVYGPAAGLSLDRGAEGGAHATLSLPMPA